MAACVVVVLGRRARLGVLACYARDWRWLSVLGDRSMRGGYRQARASDAVTIYGRCVREVGAYPFSRPRIGRTAPLSTGGWGLAPIQTTAYALRMRNQGLCPSPWHSPAFPAGCFPKRLRTRSRERPQARGRLNLVGFSYRVAAR